VQDAARDFIDALARNRRQEGEEFLAAPAHDHVGLAQRDAQVLGDHLQHGVAGGVAVGVVDVLEVVDVEQEQRTDDVFTAVVRAFFARPSFSGCSCCA
jgi:hypothetical protein